MGLNMPFWISKYSRGQRYKNYNNYKTFLMKMIENIFDIFEKYKTRLKYTFLYRKRLYLRIF